MSMQLLYAHEYNKRHHFFKEVIKMPIKKYMTGVMVDDLEEHIYNNGPLTDVEDNLENDAERFQNKTQTHGDAQAQEVEQHHEHTPQVQELPVAPNNDEREQQEAANTSYTVVDKNARQPSTLLEDLFHDNIPVHEAAAVEGKNVGLETTGDPITDEFTIPPVDMTKIYKSRNEREKDTNDEGYIPSTSDFNDDWYEVTDFSELNLVMGIGIQTQKLFDCSTPIQLTGVHCDEAAREASKKSKKVLLKNMDRNIKKYIALVTEMNEIVTTRKEKYFWDPEIMRRCKKWDDTVKDTVTDHKTCGSDEDLLNKDVQDEANIQHFVGDKDASVQKENTEKTKTNVIDTAKDMEQEIEQDVNLAESSQQKTPTQNTVTNSMMNELEKINPDAYGEQKTPNTSAEDANDEVTDAEMQSVETLLKLAPILQTTSPGSKKILTEKEKDEIVRAHIKKITAMNEKRMRELGDAYRSPYCNRIVSLYEPLLDRDKTIISYLLSTIGDIGAVMYKSESGVETLKIIFESFHPSQFVASNGVDAFVDVLNYEEKKRDKKSSPYRLFLPTTLIVS
ncbi:hypothetical protein HanOQP8_Chr14g0538691 [Helianthus annuus]|nr:hypothetical protein HanOQP8_Chr14g0538691 [Helianthus annuus]